MPEKSRESRFDEVFQMVLIIVALSFDILWFSGDPPVEEITVFMFVLLIWAYGTLRGGIWEYALKLGSFNLSLMLLTNFYTVGIIQDPSNLGMLYPLLSVVVLPLACVIVSVVLALYLKEFINREIALGVLVGGTLGYCISVGVVLLLPG
jgi:hypothetical protein